MAKRYAIVDIETTGGRASRNKITEIAIVLHDGAQIIDSWSTLVNPECYIPYGITQLTGITQEMVQDAPKFYEVAKDIVEMTKGTIFVAHNVRFDYSFIREEFSRLGYTFSRRQLCTVRLCRKAFPGLRSYSLEHLIRHFNIKVKDRHRALADTMATVQVFEKILQKENAEATMTNMVNLGIKESLLPKNLTLEKLHALPESCGVYYFHDADGNLAYVGKSINIKKRVAEHFTKVTEKARKLQQHVHEISYELTGSELVALLLESHEIKYHRPYINRAQRRRNFPYVVHQYTNTAGYLCYGIAKPLAKDRKKLNIVSEYPKAGNARAHLARVVEEYELCNRLCNLEKGQGVCFNYHLKKCYGACGTFETAEAYNERAMAALERLSTVFEEDFFIIDRGRTVQERTVVLVESGEYRGFGYVDAEEGQDFQQLRDAIKTYESNPEVKKIIRRYLVSSKTAKVMEIPARVFE